MLSLIKEFVLFFRLAALFGAVARFFYNPGFWRVSHYDAGWYDGRFTGRVETLVAAIVVVLAFRWVTRVFQRRGDA